MITGYFPTDRQFFSLKERKRIAWFELGEFSAASWSADPSVGVEVR